jgi:ribosome-associated protein
MDIRKLQRAIVDGLEDVKAQNVVVFNTEHLTPLFERVIVASGASNRQTKALANSVRETVKSRGMDVLRTEGEENGEWIIVDCGAAVVHVMQPAIRDYYHLEELWGEKPVRMKIDTAPVKLVKAAPYQTEPAARAASSRPAPRQSPRPTSRPTSRAATAKPEPRTPAAHKSTGRPAAKPAGASRSPTKAAPAAKRAPLAGAKKGPAKRAAASVTRKTIARPAPAAKSAANLPAKLPAQRSANLPLKRAAKPPAKR